MKNLEHMIHDEIHLIEESGIKMSNVKLLGELVDIYKDLVNVDYWKYKMDKKEEMTVEEKIANVHKMYDEKQKGNHVDDEVLQKHLSEMLSLSEKFNECLRKFKLSPDMQNRYDRIYR